MLVVTDTGNDIAVRMFRTIECRYDTKQVDKAGFREYVEVNLHILIEMAKPMLEIPLLISHGE
jgi:hypothetical protein